MLLTLMSQGVSRRECHQWRADLLLEALTPNEIAVRLGVERPVISQWVRAGLLPVAAVNVDGEPLIFDHHLELHGEALRFGRPEDLRSPRLRQLWRKRHRCVFCRVGVFRRRRPASPRSSAAMPTPFNPPNGLPPPSSPPAPNDPFFRRLADVTREAFERHIGSGTDMPPGRLVRRFPAKSTEIEAAA